MFNTENDYINIIKDFRNLIDFINNDAVLLENIYLILKKYFNFDVAGIFFNSPDDFELNTLNIYIENNSFNLKNIEKQFFSCMKPYKKIIKTSVKICKGNKNFTMIKRGGRVNEIVLPFRFNNLLMGGLCLYSRENILKNNIENFNFIINEFLSIYKLKYMYLEQTYKSSIDPLTNLYNRAQFKIGLEQEFNRAQRYKNTFSVAMLDIDYFKNINDSYGHQFGDFVLKEVSKIIQNTFRKTDIVYRYGGEEIAIIMPETNKESAYLPLEKLRKKIEKYNFDNKNITVSIGVSDYDDNSDIQQLLRKADTNLYFAKNNGRNIVCKN